MYSLTAGHAQCGSTLCELYPGPCHSRDVLTVENAQRLLQGFDLFLATGDSIIVAHARINTRRLQFIEVRQGRIQFLLCTLEISLLLSTPAPGPASLPSYARCP